MKMMVRVPAVMLLVLGGFAFSGCNLDDDATTPTYSLRDKGPAGGWVFYDKGIYSDGWRYLEAWTEDEGDYQWRIEGSSGEEETSTDIGSGYNNTYTLLSTPSYPAAEEARGATHGGKSDWFLPSKDELDKMWINLWRGTDDDAGNATYTRVGSFADEYYWSSSHVNTPYAWEQSFSNGTQGNKEDKTSSKKVRVVRAF